MTNPTQYSREKQRRYFYLFQDIEPGGFAYNPEHGIFKLIEKRSPNFIYFISINSDGELHFHLPIAGRDMEPIEITEELLLYNGFEKTKEEHYFIKNEIYIFNSNTQHSDGGCWQVAIPNPRLFSDPNKVKYEFDPITNKFSATYQPEYIILNRVFYFLHELQSCHMLSSLTWNISPEYQPPT